MEDLLEGVALPGYCTTRTARKSYRCVCADPVSWWTVRRICEHGWTEGRVKTEAEVERLIAERRGTTCHGSNVPVDERFEVEPRLNPEHRDGALAGFCQGDIAPGDRYVEYLGESAAWESGSRYCAPCGIAVWSVSVSR